VRPIRDDPFYRIFARRVVHGLKYALSMDPLRIQLLFEDSEGSMKARINGPWLESKPTADLGERNSSNEAILDQLSLGFWKLRYRLCKGSFHGTLPTLAIPLPQIHIRREPKVGAHIHDSVESHEHAGRSNRHVQEPVSKRCFGRVRMACSHRGDSIREAITIPVDEPFQRQGRAP
jgi:hypothetical protein